MIRRLYPKPTIRYRISVRPSRMSEFGLRTRRDKRSSGNDSLALDVRGSIGKFRSIELLLNEKSKRSLSCD